MTIENLFTTGATCTLTHEENEDVVEDFLRRERGFTEDRDAAVRSGLTELVDGRGRMYTSPQRHGTDGFFVASMLRR